MSAVNWALFHVDEFSIINLARLKFNLLALSFRYLHEITRMIKNSLSVFL